MKRIALLSLCLALVLALSGLALGEEMPTQSPALLTFDGRPVTQEEIDKLLTNLVANGYVENAQDYQLGMEYWIQDQVIVAKIAELGLDQFTQEEEDAFLKEAQGMWDEAIAEYAAYFLSEDTEEARASVRAQGEAYYQSMGYSVEVLADNLKLSASYDKLNDVMLEGKEIIPTEEEVRQVFEQYAAQDQTLYAGSVSTYEMYTHQYGQESWYMPEGYRGIIHILLEVDGALLQEYQNLQASLEEEHSQEEGAKEGQEAPAVTQADVDAALQAILDSKKAEIEDIYASLEKGESFQALIARYGADPGMQNEETLSQGYPVHKDSIVWDPVFTAGAYSEKMVKPGDVSDPVVGSYGIHILYYLRDIPGGFVDISDTIYGQIEEYLKNVKTNDVFAAAIAQWTAQHTVEYHQEAINAALGLTNLDQPVQDQTTQEQTNQDTNQDQPAQEQTNQDEPAQEQTNQEQPAQK